MNRSIIITDRLEEIDDYLNLFSEDELLAIESYVGMCGKIHDISQFYQLFSYNISLFKRCFNIYYNDFITDLNGTPATEVEVNTHIINIASAGRTVVEIIEGSLKDFPEGDVFKKNTISSTFDKSFSYKLVYYIRNYGQHGHFPVKNDDGYFSFDLDYILTEENYNGNKSTKAEFVDLATDLHEFHGGAKVACVLSILQFICDVINIYIEYLKWIRTKVASAENEVIRITSEIDRDVIVYSIKDGYAHAFHKDFEMMTKIKTDLSFMKNEFNTYSKNVQYGKKHSFESIDLQHRWR